MCRLFHTGSNSDNLAVFLSTITGASRFANILEGDWVELVEIAPYPWEDNGILWFFDGCADHTLAVVFIELDPFGGAECVPSRGLFEFAAGKLWDCKSFEDGESDGFI